MPTNGCHARAPRACSKRVVSMNDKIAKQQLDNFIARYSPEVAGVARQALKKMRARLPGAVELVYDNYNALAIGFGPSERTGDLIFSITLYPRWVSLFFTQGADLPDPGKLLRGSGKKIRHIVLDDVTTLDKPHVRTLMNHALKLATVKPDAKTSGRIVIKSVVARQRPRRPGKKS